jgi:diphthamide biosynthesis protein 7
VFGVATSTGSIDLYQLTDAEGKPVDQPIGTEVIPQIKHLKTIQYVEKDILITAFSWYPHDPRVGMSLSNGQILVASTAEDDSTDCVFTHDLEAWTLAFTPDGQGVYSGGDDSVLSYSSEISGLQEPHLRSSWADRRIHEAGVTAILPLQGNPDKHLVVTGSYDDRIRLLEIPSTGRRKVLAEANLGGGVWRLKALVPITFDSTEEGLDGVLLLASCMHAGARILRLSRSGHDDWHFEVLAKFDKHKSMNYGSDCQSQATERGQRTFVTTSFYDRLLCLWRY